MPQRSSLLAFAYSVMFGTLVAAAMLKRGRRQAYSFSAVAVSTSDFDKTTDGLSATAPDTPDQTSPSAPNSVTLPSQPSVSYRAPRVRESLFEPITSELLRRRRLDLFSGGYLTFIAIIQGVGMVVLVERAMAVLTDDIHTGWLRVTVAGQVGSNFLALVIVTYLYLRFTAVLAWPLTFIDTLLPYVLGAAETTSAELIGYRSAWWASYAALTTMGLLAFMRTHLKSTTVPFDVPEYDSRTLSDHIRKLTLWQMAFSAALTIWCLINLTMSYRSGEIVLVYLAFAAWTPVCLGPLLMKSSERNIVAFYDTLATARQEENA